MGVVKDVEGRVFTWLSTVTCQTKFFPAPAAVVHVMDSEMVSLVMEQGAGREGGKKVISFLPEGRGSWSTES